MCKPGDSSSSAVPPCLTCNTSTYVHIFVCTVPVTPNHCVSPTQPKPFDSPSEVHSPTEAYRFTSTTGSLKCPDADYLLSLNGLHLNYSTISAECQVGTQDSQSEAVGRKTASAHKIRNGSSSECGAAVTVYTASEVFTKDVHCGCFCA